jgi:hypothetical protein
MVHFNLCSFNSILYKSLDEKIMDQEVVPKSRIREVLHNISQEAKRVEQNVGTVEKHGISRNTIGK